MLENDKYGPTTKKLKTGQKHQKMLKHTENSLEKFHDQETKQIFFLTETVSSKLGLKRLQTPETRWKTNNSVKQQQNWK